MAHDRISLVRRNLPRAGQAGEQSSRLLTVLSGTGIVVAAAAISALTLAGVDLRRDAVDPGLGLRGAVGVVALISAVTLLYGVYLGRFHRRVLSPVDTPARRWLFAVVACVVLLCVKAQLVSPLEPQWAFLMIPAPLAGMFLAVVYDQRLAFDTMLATFVLAAVMGVAHMPDLAPQLLATGAVLFGGTTAAIILTRNLRSRTKLVSIGLVAGGFMAAGQCGLWLLGLSASGDGSLLDLLLWAAVALAHGVAAGALATAFLPVIESMFGIVTEAKLIELESGNHPLLRQMLEVAPGTYMHTQNVARLASAAVEAVGGNALLARVGTLFHDIGKMVRPEYFTENEPNSKLHHDRLTPFASTLIIMAHVKDGVSLARDHKLPPILLDFITGHHGTSPITYFYRTALANDPSVREEQFRYPGPKPQTREAAIVAVADLVEAAGRAKLEGKQTPASLQKFVRECIEMKLKDGQFDECDITLQDLRLAEVAMTRVLASMYHHRIKYPDAPDATRRKLVERERKEHKAGRSGRGGGSTISGSVASSATSSATIAPSAAPAPKILTQ